MYTATRRLKDYAFHPLCGRVCRFGWEEEGKKGKEGHSLNPSLSSDVRVFFSNREIILDENWKNSKLEEDEIGGWRILANESPSSRSKTIPFYLHSSLDEEFFRRSREAWIRWMGKKEGDVMAFTFKSFEFLEGYSRSDAVRNARDDFSRLDSLRDRCCRV